MSLTDEQRAVADWPAEPRHALIVNAVAGSGKTSTLTHFCRNQAARGRRVLLVVFGRSDAEDARARLTGVGGVDVRTFDSIAFAAAVRANLQVGYDVNPWQMGQYVATNFEAVAKPLLQGTPKRYLPVAGKRRGRGGAVGGGVPTGRPNFFLLRMDVAEMVVPVLQALLARGAEPQDATDGQWAEAVGAFPETRMQSWWRKHGQDVGRPLAQAAHDAFNRRLRGPATPCMVEWSRLFTARTSPPITQSVLVVDEAQDLNPNMVRWVLRQRHAGLLLCGDARQHIFQFQHTTDGFLGVRDACRADGGSLTEASLSASFRFNGTIAAHVNRVFGTRLRGLGGAQGAQVVQNVSLAQAIEHGMQRPLTLLVRTNRHLAEVLWALLTTLSRRAPAVGEGGDGDDPAYMWESVAWGKPTVCVMGLPSLARMGEEALRMVRRQGRRKTTDELSEIRSSVDQWVVHTYGATKVLRMLDFVAAMKERHGTDLITEDRAAARLVVSTVHRAKGKEWDTVFVSQEIVPGADRSEEQLNIAYTAMTRARHTLLLPPSPAAC